MTDIRRIDDRISVAPQILPDEVSDIAALGFVIIVNNRPDNEEGAQPGGDEIRAAAEAAGLSYLAIPVSPGGLSREQVDAMAEALAAAHGPVLAYCRSGTRSCNLWALASASTGGDPETLVGKGASAGYDLSGLRGTLEALSRG